jgi:hypothetical protein
MKKLIKKNKLMIFVFPLFLAGCGSQKIVPNSGDIVLSQKGLLDFTVSWVKDQSKAFETEVRISNTGEKSILIFQNDFLCYRGDIQGQLKASFFDKKEKTLDFKPGDVKLLKLVCDLQNPTKGPFKLVLKKVVEDKDSNGKKDIWTEVILAKDITWILESRERKE